MLRCFALTVGLLAALPAGVAGEMNADEARQFVIGKTFNYTCFEGTRGQGRINADGSVAGFIQIQGAGPVRYAELPANTRKSEAGLFAPPCVACRSSLASTSSARATPASADRFRDWALPPANLPGMAGGRSWPTACTVRTARSRWAPSIARRRQ